MSEKSAYMQTVINLIARSLEIVDMIDETILGAHLANTLTMAEQRMRELHDGGSGECGR